MHACIHLVTTSLAATGYSLPRVSCAVRTALSHPVNMAGHATFTPRSPIADKRSKGQKRLPWNRPHLRARTGRPVSIPHPRCLRTAPTFMYSRRSYRTPPRLPIFAQKYQGESRQKRSQCITGRQRRPRSQHWTRVDIQHSHSGGSGSKPSSAAARGSKTAQGPQPVRYASFGHPSPCGPSAAAAASRRLGWA